MSIFTEENQCLICSETYNVMISLDQTLGTYDTLTVAQILHNLYSPNIPDVKNLDLVYMCFICLAQVYYCYQLKTKCDRLEKQIGIVPANIHCRGLKEENCFENDNSNEYKEKLGSISVEKVGNDNLSLPTIGPIDCNGIKSEMDIDEGILEKNRKSEDNIAENGENIREKSFICPICHKGFAFKYRLRLHSIIHIAKKLHVCDVCNKSFTKSSNLRVHKLIHTSEKAYVCDVCNKSFTILTYLNKHKLVHTGKKPYVNKKPHVCDICNKSFRRRYRMISHKYTHTGERPFGCDICYKTFKDAIALRIHEKIHRKSHVCDVCNKAYGSQDRLMKHQRNHRNNCDICNKSFTRPDNLKRHKLVHTKPYVCDVCDKSFAQERNLKKHKLIHIDKKLDLNDGGSKLLKL